MQAVILAGGKGTRLRPYTTVFPKPLVPLDDIPIIEVVLRQLALAGFDRVILTTGHLAELIRAFCGDGSKWGIRIDYAHESQPLGTAGPLALLADKLDENFLVMNGDLLTTLSFKNLVNDHVSKKSLATVGLYRRDVKIDFGVIETNDNGHLARYIEKPTYHFDVSMGINVFHRDVLRYIPAGQRLDIPDLITKLREDGKNVSCYREDCYWLDIGRADDYQTASDEFQKRRRDFLPE